MHERRIAITSKVKPSAKRLLQSVSACGLKEGATPICNGRGDQAAGVVGIGGWQCREISYLRRMTMEEKVGVRPTRRETG